MFIRVSVGVVIWVMGDEQNGDRLRIVAVVKEVVIMVVDDGQIEDHR